MRLAQRPRVVLDTNVVFSGLYTRSGPPFEIVHRWHTRQFALVLTPAINAEYHRIIAAARADKRMRLDGFDSELFFRLLAIDALWFEASVSLLVHSRDPADDILLEAAMASNAAFLVSGDKDLLVLNGDPRLGALHIVHPQDFLIALARTI